MMTPLAAKHQRRNARTYFEGIISCIYMIVYVLKRRLPKPQQAVAFAARLSC